METPQETKQDLRNSCGFTYEVIYEAVKHVYSCFLNHPASNVHVCVWLQVYFYVIMNHSFGGTHSYSICAIRKKGK